MNMYAFVSQDVCMCISAHSLHTAANGPTVALEIPGDGVSDTCVQTDVQIQYASPIGGLENPAS